MGNRKATKLIIRAFQALSMLGLVFAIFFQFGEARKDQNFASRKIKFHSEQPAAAALSPENIKSNRTSEAVRDVCQLTEFNGTVAWILFYWDIGDGSVQYFDPADCGDSPTYPFEITSIEFSLYVNYDDPNHTYFSFPVEMDIVVYQLTTIGNPCQGPGTKIYRFSLSADEANFRYPNVGMAIFPEPVCVNGPIFIGVEYTDPRLGSSELPPCILSDKNGNVNTCHQWFYDVSGGGWLAWNDHFSDLADSVGYQYWFVNGETVSSNCAPVEGRCCFGNPDEPDCVEEYETDCLARGDFISWNGNLDCLTSCLPDGRCCYGVPENPDCAYELESECNDRPDYISWTEGIDCLVSCLPEELIIRAGASPEISPDTIPASDIFIDIYMNNNSGNTYSGYSAPFVIYSPDQSISNVTHLDVGGYGPDGSIILQNGFEDDTYWDYMNQIHTWSWDGALPDTFCHLTIAFTGGLPSGLGEQLYIRVALNIAEEGILCLDSVSHPNPAYDWLFSPPAMFNGPFCWDVVIDNSPGRCCFGEMATPECDVLTEMECRALPDYISWSRGLDCTTPCPRPGQCCYGLEGSASCSDEYYEDCTSRPDFISWIQDKDCSEPCPEGFFDVSYLFDGSLWCVDAADLDQDNNIDLVYINAGISGSPLFIAFGHGDGTFDSPVSVLSGYGIFDFAFINDDGLLDIVAAGQSTIAILLNIDGRHFDVSTISHSSGTIYMMGMASGYFNDDAYVDIVVPPDRVYFGDITSTFSTFTTLTNFYSADVSDFDNDGIDDIIAVTTDGWARIFTSNGLGGFTYTGGFDLTNLTINVTTANALADFDRDGNSDFATVVFQFDYSDETAIMIGFGNGTGGIMKVDTLLFDGGGHYLVSTDVNRDNNLDLIFSNVSNHSFDIFYGDEFGNFADRTVIRLPSNLFCMTLATGDFDRDGNPDFITGEWPLDNEPLLLLLNTLPDAPVIDDNELMIIATAFDNAGIGITNPQGFSISRNYSTVAGSEYWRFDQDGNDDIDESTYDYNVQYGEYTIILFPSPDAEEGALFSTGIRINGTQQIRPFNEYSFIIDRKSGIRQSYDSLVFYYTVDSVTRMYPPNGEATPCNRPVFSWAGMINDPESIDNYHFQLDRYFDFYSPIYDIDNLTSPTFNPPNPLGEDSVFYWHFRIFNGVEWSEYSRTFAAYIVPGYNMCGDVVCDGTVNILDIVFLVNYKFKSGEPPCSMYLADVNNDAAVNILDIVYLINYKFKSGPEPNCP